MFNLKILKTNKSIKIKVMKKLQLAVNNIFALVNN